MASTFRLDLLGPLRGWSGDEPVDLGPVRLRSLLAVLALRANQVLTPDELIELVWSDQPPSSGAKIVPPYIYRLRKYLPDGVLDRTRHGYSLRLGPDALDLSRFETLVVEAQRVREQGELDRATNLLRAALELFTGEPLSGLAGHYLTVQRHRLVEQLGVEPGPLLRTTHQRILGGSPSAVPRGAGRDELPYEGAAFVGRQDELARVVDAVTGTPGRRWSPSTVWPVSARPRWRSGLLGNWQTTTRTAGSSSTCTGIPLAGDRWRRSRRWTGCCAVCPYARPDPS